MKFWRNIQGNVGLLFGICSVPVIGALGIAIDIARLNMVQTRMQADADAAALSARGGEWISEAQYRVTAEQDVPLTLSAILGLRSTTVRVEAIAQFFQLGWYYEPPLTLYLDPDAMDFNTVSVYCYDPVTNSMGEIIPIADNLGTLYPFDGITCPRNSRLEFQLRSLVYGLSDPPQRSNPNAWIVYLHSHTPEGTSRIETMRCDRVQDCAGVSEGGIVQEGEYRTPNKETRPCTEGRFMYYGWEDRPGWDNDFDDIRIVMKCPVEEGSGLKPIRLIR